MIRRRLHNEGIAIVNTLVFAFIAIVITTAFVSWVSRLVYSIRHLTLREQAFQIAEAGIDYYRWHLAHNQNDFQDGTGGPGPYVHSFEDKDGNVIGQFILDITPPTTGTTIVVVRSTGIITSPIEVERTIEAKFAITSLAKYAAISNSDIRFSEGTEVFGHIHSNYGIRFDGLAHNVVSSSLLEYKDPDHSGNKEYAVHTHISPVDPLPPLPLPLRPDVFEAGRFIGVPQVDFTSITSALAQIKSEAVSDGIHLEDSGALGWLLLLKTNNTFDVYRVDSLVAVPNGCTTVLGQQWWGSWSIQNKTFAQNYVVPESGLVFVEDNVWVEGQIDGTHITIAAGVFPGNPSKRKSITINNDLLYSNYDGKDVIGLIAQGNINVGLVSEDDLRIDAALVAQNGRVGRYYYKPPSGGNSRCDPYHIRQTVTLYGMIATNERYGFAYTDGTGYQNRNIIYDSNLLYGPPPSFPLTSDQYSILSWEEL